MYQENKWEGFGSSFFIPTIDGLEKCRGELTAVFQEGNVPLQCQSKFKMHMPISY